MFPTRRSSATRAFKFVDVKFSRDNAKFLIGGWASHPLKLIFFNVYIWTGPYFHTSKDESPRNGLLEHHFATKPCKEPQRVHEEYDVFVDVAHCFSVTNKPEDILRTTYNFHFQSWACLRCSHDMSKLFAQPPQVYEKCSSVSGVVKSRPSWHIDARRTDIFH